MFNSRVNSLVDQSREILATQGYVFDAPDIDSDGESPVSIGVGDIEMIGCYDPVELQKIDLCRVSGGVINEAGLIQLNGFAISFEDRVFGERHIVIDVDQGEVLSIDDEGRVEDVSDDEACIDLYEKGLRIIKLHHDVE